MAGLLDPIQAGAGPNMQGLWERAWALWLIQDDRFSDLADMLGYYRQGRITVYNREPGFVPTFVISQSARTHAVGGDQLDGIEVFIQGTSNVKQLLVDLAAVPPLVQGVNPPVFVHPGFWGVAVALFEVLRDNHLAPWAGSVGRLTVSGHSLGAAVAALVAGMAKEWSLANNGPKVYCAAFAQPAAHGSNWPHPPVDFGVQIRKRYDVVPNLPPKNATYVLPGAKTAAQYLGKLTSALEWAHDGVPVLVNYDKEPVINFDQDDADAEAWQTPKEWADAHPILTYVQCLEHVQGVLRPLRFFPDDPLQKRLEADAIQAQRAWRASHAAPDAFQVHATLTDPQAVDASNLLYGVAAAVLTGTTAAELEPVHLTAGEPIIEPAPVQKSPPRPPKTLRPLLAEPEPAPPLTFIPS